jgi:hypothetical protein
LLHALEHVAESRVMNRVTGIGGVFFRAKDPQALGAWYRKHLGIPVEDWGGAAFCRQSDDKPQGARRQPRGRVRVVGCAIALPASARRACTRIQE